jgi:DNA repair exonuclease SbcCD ATPase subunit
MDYDRIRSDGERLREDLQQAQIHEAELQQRLQQQAETLADVQQQVSQILTLVKPNRAACRYYYFFAAVIPLSISVNVLYADSIQDAESKQLLFEKSTLLVNTVADVKALAAGLASKSQEFAMLLKKQRECEAERQRLSHDLMEANSFKDRIFATVNQIAPLHGPRMD